MLNTRKSTSSSTTGGASTAWLRAQVDSVPPMGPRTTTNPPKALWRVLAIIAGVGAVLVGGAVVLIAATLGSCSAFGGTCPSTPPPLLDDDVFRIAAMGTALAVGLPVFLRAPSRRRLAVSLALAVGAALVVGLAVRSGAYG